jgi:hypothetical protein
LWSFIFAAAKMGCGSSKATPIVPTPQRLLLPMPDGDAPESVVSRCVSVGKQLSLVDGKYARCELGLKAMVEDLVLEVLQPLGLRMVVSSRPEGVSLMRYSPGWVIIS